MYPYIISLYLVTAAIKKFQKKIIPFETRNQPVKKKMLFFSQVDLQLTGGTKCTETFQKNSQMFITSHRLPQRIVACCVGISAIFLFKPKKMSWFHYEFFPGCFIHYKATTIGHPSFGPTLGFISVSSVRATCAWFRSPSPLPPARPAANHQNFYSNEKTTLTCSNASWTSYDWGAQL